MPNILLIDDNRNFQLGLARNLRRQGFQVVTASNGIEGIQLANDLLPELILCDIKMPDADGMTVKQALNAATETADIPFIFLSALSTTQFITKGLNAGAEDYVTKPVDLDELVARIRSALRRREKADSYAKQEVLALLEKLKTTLPIHTSHLYRTYVGTLLLTLETLKSQIPHSETYLQGTYEITYRLKMLINSLVWINEFDLDQVSTFKERLDLDLSFRLPLSDLLKGWKQKDLNVQFQIDPEMIIFAPAHSFSLAVCHLVDNACKFSPIRGTVQISLERNGVGGCILTIQDQGPGIPIHFREQVFNRYFQIPSDEILPQNHGLGLGLYLARAFAKTQGGDVRIQDSFIGCQIQMKF